MAELFANATEFPATITLTSAINAVVTTVPVSAAAPTSLHGGQFRVRIGDELLLVTAGQDTTSWTVTRGVEGSTAATHSIGAIVRHLLTAAALSQAVESGSGLPDGGTTGQALVKQSSTDGDADWQDTAALSNDAPLADGVAAAGTGDEASRSDHVHPGGQTLMPAANPVILAPGGYFTWPTGRSGPGGVMTLAREFAIPVVFDAEYDVNIGLNITTAGSAGAVLRIGVRADDDGLPGTLLLDLGTIDATGTGPLSKAGFTPEAGVRYWLSYSPQVVADTVISSMQRGVPVPLFGSANPADIGALFQTGVAGALPSTFTVAGGASFTGAMYVETA